MPTFTYKARDRRGIEIGGTVEAPSQIEALRSLRGDGLVVTDIREGAGIVIDTTAIRMKQAARSVKVGEVVSFSEQLSVMLETGVPLSEAMQAYLKQSKGGNLCKVVETVTCRITGGMSFSASIADFPRVFPPLAVSLIKASEATGRLGEMLGRVAEYIGKEVETRRQIKGALTYPAVMLSMAVSVTSFLVVWVLPRFAKIYESRSAALPKPTKILLDISGFVIGNWILLVLGIAAIAGSVFATSQTRRGRRAIDWLKIHMPVFGSVFSNFYLTRAASTLGTLLEAGIPLLQAIDIVRGVTPNVLWNDLWDRMEISLKGGGMLQDAITDTPLVPPAAAQMIAAGERAGKLPDVLARIAKSSEKEFDEKVKTGTQLIEPVVIIFMGIMIGGIALALLLPIFTMGNVLSK
jgi:type II secretory pathway component PulF